MIQFRNLDLWWMCTSNKGMQDELERECQKRHQARKYIDLANHTAHLQYELERMWEEELMCD